MSDTPVTSGEGGTIVLTCIVDANPDITSFYWSRVGQGRISSASNPTKYGGGTITDQSLLIRGATSSDSGQYFCTASNDIGTVTSSVVSVSVTSKFYTEVVRRTYWHDKSRSRPVNCRLPVSPFTPENLIMCESEINHATNLHKELPANVREGVLQRDHNYPYHTPIHIPQLHNGN